MKLHDDISFYFILTLFIRPAFVNLCRFVLILATAVLSSPFLQLLIEPRLPIYPRFGIDLEPSFDIRFVSSQTMSIHRVGPASALRCVLSIAFYSCLRVYGVSTSGIWARSLFFWESEYQ